MLNSRTFSFLSEHLRNVYCKLQLWRLLGDCSDGVCVAFVYTAAAQFINVTVASVVVVVVLLLLVLLLPLRVYWLLENQKGAYHHILCVNAALAKSAKVIWLCIISSVYWL